MWMQRGFRFLLAGVLTLSLSGLWSGTAEAVIYSWTDDSGKKHFTTEKAKIPRKYRKKERLKATGGKVTVPKKNDAPSAGGPGSGGLEIKKGPKAEGGGEGGGAGGAEAEKKKDEKNPYTPAQIQLIKDSHKLMKALPNKYKRVMNSSHRNNQEAKWYFLTVQRLLGRKKEVQQRIDGELPNLPFLVGISEFLEQTAEYPFSLIGKGDDVLARLDMLINRMNQEISSADGLRSDLEQEMDRIVKQVGKDIFASDKG